VLGLSIVFAATVIVYIQQAKGWVVGFSVPVVLMVTALTLFLLGSPFYLKAAADRSAILGLVQVLVASYKNRHEPMPPIKLLHFCFSSSGRWKNSLDALIKSSIKEVSISWLST